MPIDSRSRPRASAAASIIVAAVILTGCDGGVRIRGRVVDGAGAPVPGAQIQLERGPNDRSFSDRVRPDGCFRLGHVVAPGRYKYKLHVVAAGFAAAEGIVSTVDDNYATVILRRPGDSERSSIQVSVGDWPQGTGPMACGTK